MSVTRALSTVLGVSPEEWPLLRSLAGLFVVGSAAATLTASAAKAMFLTANPLSALPWVLMAQAAWGLSIALVYARATARYDVTRRFLTLILLSLASFAGLWALFGAAPAGASLVAAIWAPGLVQLVLIQTWSLPTTFLPSRTTKRLLPILAAVATFGAAAGGALTRLTGSLLPTETLLLLAGGLLGSLGLFVPGVVRGLRAVVPEIQTRTRAQPASLRAGFLDVAHSPLLGRLAAVVFLAQFASVLVEYQLAGELKARYDKEAMSVFLGTFYTIGNLLVLGVSLLATQRLVRFLGLGICVSAVAMLVGLGSGAYLVGAISGAFPAFYALVGTAAAERVGQFALSRNAAQMLLAPLDARTTEHARTLIDGVVYRGASLVASIALLGVATLPLWGLTIPVLLGCIAVVVVGLRIEPHYRRALYESLGTGDLQVGGAVGRVVLDASAEDGITRALNSTDEAEIVRGLELVQAVGAAPDIARIEALAAGGSAIVSPAALETLRVLEVPLRPELLEGLLRPDRPAPVLRAALSALGGTDPPELQLAVQNLRGHADATVAALAHATSPVPGLAPEPLVPTAPMGDLATLMSSSELEVRRGLVELLGQGGVDAGLPPLLRSLEDHLVRDEAVVSLSRYGARLVPAAAEAFAADRLSETAQVALLHAVARTRAPAARDLLMSMTRMRATALRNAAVRGLWRMAAEEDLKPDPTWLVNAARREIELQSALVAAATMIDGDERHEFLRAELREQARMAERRVFGFLGLLYGRAELHRAQCHLRSENPRSRSNAIELLDQKLRHATLRSFIDLVEGRAVPTLPGAVDLDRVEACPTVLLRMEKWLRGRHDAELDRAHQLRRADLFGETSAEAIAALARDVTIRVLLEAERLPLAGTVVVVLEGTARVTPGDRRLSVGDTAGALEALAGERLSGELTALGRTVLALVPAGTLEEHLTNHPALVRALLRKLGGRLRHLNTQRS
jgi:hypothetical protein